MTKIIVSRLAPSLKKIISPEQLAFIQGRRIFGNISLAQELVQGINRKVQEENMSC